MPVPIHQTLEQQRAKIAWNYAHDAKTQLGKNFKEYVSLVKKLPALVYTNGLGQTVAFLAAKTKIKIDKDSNCKRVNGEGLLYNQLEQWLTQKTDPQGPYASQANEEKAEPSMKLLYYITSKDSATYRRATIETLHLITWLKSFADALQEKN